MMQTMKASNVREEWSELLGKVFRQKSRILVERSGIPVVAIISTEDLEKLTRFEQERKLDLAILEESQNAFKDESPATIQQALASALAAIRDERQAKKQLRAPTT